MGDVRCNRIIHYRSKEPGSKEHPKLPGYENVNVTSGNSRWKALSPMKLGPFHLVEKTVPTPLYPDGIHPGFKPHQDGKQVIQCMNFENIWQGSKIYDIDVDANGVMGASFYERRARMAADVKPHRRALPKSAGVTCVGAYWNGEVLAYIPSRAQYCSKYAHLVRVTDEYRQLEVMLQNGTNLHIIGYDGFDVPVTAEDMRAAYLNPDRPFGHELVLCCMLKGLSPWTQPV